MFQRHSPKTTIYDQFHEQLWKIYFTISSPYDDKIDFLSHLIHNISLNNIILEILTKNSLRNGPTFLTCPEKNVNNELIHGWRNRQISTYARRLFFFFLNPYQLCCFFFTKNAQKSKCICTLNKKSWLQKNRICKHLPGL